MEPLYVVKHGGKFLVKEGNRRTVALRKLQEQVEMGQVNFPRGYFSRIPCEVFREDVPAEEIALFLTRIHVKGKKRFEKSNQAAYLYYLNRELGVPQDKLVGIAS